MFVLYMLHMLKDIHHKPRCLTQMLLGVHVGFLLFLYASTSSERQLPMLEEKQ